MALTTLADVKTFLQISSSDTTQDAQLTMLIGDATTVITVYLRGRRLDQDTYTEYHSGNGTRFVILKQRPAWSVQNVWIDYNGYFGQAVNTDGTVPFADTTVQALGTYDLVLDETLNGPPLAWSALTPYRPGDRVTSGSLFYLCIVGNTNQAPPNAAYWVATTADALVSKSGLLARINWNWPDIGAIAIPGNLAREGGQFLGNIKVQYVAGYPAGYVPGDLQYAARILISQMRQAAPRGYPVQSKSVTDYSYSLMTPSAGQAPEIGSIRQILNRYREVPGLGGDLSSLPSNNTSGMWR
jgi:hypothetical protein